MALKEAADKVLERTRALVDNKESVTIFEEKMEMLRHSVSRYSHTNAIFLVNPAAQNTYLGCLCVYHIGTVFTVSRCASCIDAKVDN